MIIPKRCLSTRPSYCHFTMAVERRTLLFPMERLYINVLQKFKLSFKNLFKMAIAAIDDPLRNERNCFYRLWHRSRNNRLNENEKKAFNTIEKNVVENIYRKPAFRAMKENINRVTATILKNIRLKMSKDSSLFCNLRFREDEILPMSNHRLERLTSFVAHFLTNSLLKRIRRIEIPAQKESERRFKSNEWNNMRQNKSPLRLDQRSGRQNKRWHNLERTKITKASNGRNRKGKKRGQAPKT